MLSTGPDGRYYPPHPSPSVLAHVTVKAPRLRRPEPPPAFHSPLASPSSPDLLPCHPRRHPVRHCRGNHSTSSISPPSRSPASSTARQIKELPLNGRSAGNRLITLNTRGQLHGATLQASIRVEFVGGDVFRRLRAAATGTTCSSLLNGGRVHRTSLISVLPGGTSGHAGR